MSHPWARGSVVLVASRGRYTGKPRPALVVQADLWNPSHDSVTVCLITSTVVDASLFRIDVLPSTANGLRAPSQVMVDKMASIPVEDVGEVVGCLDSAVMARVDAALRRWVAL